MVDSDVGRTEGVELGDLRAQARSLAEPCDRDVRKPATRLATVEPERLEARVQVCCEPVRIAPVLLEDEHADAPRLAVAGHPEGRLFDPRGCVTERLGDVGELPNRARAEEGQRDVQFRARDDSSAQLGSLPALELVERAVGKAKAAEESEAIMASDASRRAHTASSRFCVRSVRSRWSAMTVDRFRIWSRSPGRLSSRARSPSGLTACT